MMLNNNLIKAFVNAGFTEDEATRQLEKLDELIWTKIANETLGDDVNSDMTQDDVRNVIKQNHTPEEIKSIVERVSSEVMNGYLEAVSSKLDLGRKETFYSQVFEGVQQLQNNDQPA